MTDNVKKIAKLLTDDPDIFTAQSHGDLIKESMELSEVTGAGQDILKLFDVINNANADYVLVGGHSISGYTGAPRATKDVDIVSNDWEPIVTAVKKAFPDVEVENTQIAIRIKRAGQDFLDIIKPLGGNAFYKNALNYFQWIDYGDFKVKIPDLEMALASKFSAMVSRYRSQENKFQDATDFIRMVKNNLELNLKKLWSLGEAVYKHGGGDELLGKVKMVREKREFTI